MVDPVESSSQGGQEVLDMTATEPLEEPVEAGSVAVPESGVARQRAKTTVDPLVPQSETDILRSLFHLADTIKDTEFVPKGLRGSTPKVLSAILTGREIGIGPMSSLRGVHIIEGKPDFSAALQLALIRRAGHSVTGSASSTEAVVIGRRLDNNDQVEVTWTIDRAAQAGLAEKDNWKRYPESMLWARAITELADRLFPDVFVGGLSVAESPQELEYSEV